MKYKGKLSSVVVVAAIAIWGIWQLLTRTGPPSPPSEHQIIQREHGELRGDSRPEDRDQKDAHSSKRPRPTTDSANPDGSVWTIGNAVSELKGVCETKEASRAHLMKETHVDGATVYYLDVAPPSQEEVKELRASISAIQSRVDKGNEQKMDEWVTWMIDRYDPFGSYGRRMIGIRIASEPGKRISGWSFPTDNPDATLKEMQSGSYTAPENMQFYVSSYDDKSGRFDALLVFDAGTESPGAKSYKLRTEQGGAGQPATRFESDSESGDKPQPESEGRSR